MKQHCSNAQKVVEYLKKHKEVSKVIYSTEHDKTVTSRAKKYLNGGNDQWLALSLKVVLLQGKIYRVLKMFYHVANIGDAEV